MFQNINTICIIVIICILTFLYLPLYKEKKIKGVIHHTMRVIDGKIAIKENDGRYYYMLADKPDQQEAAKIIKEINEFMVNLILELKKKYLYNQKTCFSEDKFDPDDEFVPFSNRCVDHKSNPLDDFKYRAIYLLVTRYRPNRLEENQPTSSKDTSWAEGKGDRIALCLREQLSGKYKFIDSDLIKFVAIHELTHIAANTLEHPEYFWKVFKFLLLEANALLGYKLINYKKNPVNYCGMTVTYNPVYDDKLKMTNESHDIRSLN